MNHRRRRGFALALVLFIILILATVCFAALSVSNLDMRTARQDYDAARALYASRAGVSHALSALAFDYGWSGGEGTLGDESYAVTVVPAPGNASSTSKTWKVTSIGAYQGASRTVEAYVALESFSKYAYFTDREFMTSGSVIRFSGADKISGEAHTNGYFTMSGHPRFSSSVTSANNGDTLYNASNFTYTQNGGTWTDPEKFYRTDTTGSTAYSTHSPVALDGSPNYSFAGGQSTVPLPSDTGLIAANATWSYLKSNPSTPRPLTRLVFSSGGTVQVYTRNTNGSYSLVETRQTDTMPGVTLYVEGEVEVYGTVKGRVTLGAKDNVNLIGDLVYANADSDVMGIVSDDDIVVKSSSTVQQDRYIHASLMALNGSFRVENYNQGSYRGVLHIYGGVIQNRRGPVGTGSLAQINTGYAKDYQYDEKLLNKPPLNFPTTGKIVVRSILDKGSLGST